MGPAGAVRRKARLSVVHNRGRRTWVDVETSTGIAALDVQLQRSLETMEFPPYPAGYHDDQVRLSLEVVLRTEEAPSACFTIRIPSDLGDALNVPADVQVVFERYRSGWRELCRASDGHPSLEALLKEAETLERGVDERIDERFVLLALPGMRLSIDAGFIPDPAAFAEAAAVLGTEDDRLFWSRYANLNPYFPAWIKGTWDYGGCVRFADYDWIETAKAVQALEAGVHGSKYRELARKPSCRTSNGSRRP